MESRTSQNSEKKTDRILLQRALKDKTGNTVEHSKQLKYSTSLFYFTSVEFPLIFLTYDDKRFKGTSQKNVRVLLTSKPFSVCLFGGLFIKLYVPHFTWINLILVMLLKTIYISLRRACEHTQKTFYYEFKLSHNTTQASH